MTDVAIRPALDRDFLERMLFEAFFWDATIARPPFAEFRTTQDFVKLCSDWGRTGDHGLVATENARARAIPGLSLSVSPLNKAIELYRSEGFREVGVSGTSSTMLLQMT